MRDDRRKLLRAAVTIHHSLDAFDKDLRARQTLKDESPCPPEAETAQIKRRNIYFCKKRIVVQKHLWLL